MEELIYGKNCGSTGWWISGSKGRIKISEINFFHLGAAINKIEKVTIKKYSGIEKMIPVSLREVVVQCLSNNSKYKELVKEFNTMNSFKRRK